MTFFFFSFTTSRASPLLSLAASFLLLLGLSPIPSSAVPVINIWGIPQGTTCAGPTVLDYASPHADCMRVVSQIAQGVHDPELNIAWFTPFVAGHEDQLREGQARIAVPRVWSYGRCEISVEWLDNDVPFQIALESGLTVRGYAAQLVDTCLQGNQHQTSGTLTLPVTVLTLRYHIHPRATDPKLVELMSQAQLGKERYGESWFAWVMTVAGKYYNYEGKGPYP